MSDLGIQRRAPFGDNPNVGTRGASTHRRILEAALQVFADVGFHNSRVEHITEMAECSRPSFYQYFSSKEDVFTQLAGLLGREMIAAARGLDGLTETEVGVKVLADWVEGFGDIYERYRPIFESFNAAARSNDALRSGSHDVSKWFRSALVLEAGSGYDAATVQAVAASVVTIVSGTHRHRRMLQISIPDDRFNESLARLLHRVLYGPIDGVNMDRRGPKQSGRPKVGVDIAAPEPSTPEGRTLRPQGLKTRQKILDASAIVLAKKGYHETRVDDIVEEAGVSHGSFYRYFDSKDGIFAVLATDAAAPLLELLESFPSRGDDDVRPWVDRWFNNYRDQGAIISAWQELEHPDAPAEELSMAVSDTVIRTLEKPLAGREFGDITVDALALLAMIERLPYSVFTLGEPEESQARDALELFIAKGLFASA